MRDKFQQDNEILKEQVKQLYRLAPIGFMATVMNSAIVFIIMKGVIPFMTLSLWLTAILVLTVLRCMEVIWYRRANREQTEYRRAERRFMVGGFAIGVGWGSLALFPYSIPPPHELFLAFVLGGMAAGASSTYSKIRSGFPAFSVPALVPLGVRFLLQGDPFHQAMAAMCFLYLVLLWRISQHNYAVNRSSLLLRFENQEMIERLRRAKDEVEGLNRQLMAQIEAKLEAEAELRRHRDDLERTVEERTADLVAANERVAAAKDAAEAGSLAKGQFLANMSHEMRTPLAGVIGMIRLVLDMKIGEEERTHLEMARRSADSLLRLIEDVLDFSRLEAGVMKFDRKPFSVPDTVRSAVEVVSLSAVEKGLELSWKVEDSVQEAEGDEGRLRQVLVNLLGNAIKFTERGSVEATARPYDDPEAEGAPCILFSVRDTGVGIPADHLEKIFAMFTQVDTSLTKRYGGTGLGLALSREIVEKSGGRIWAESREGAGSTFHFTIPAGAAHHHPHS